MSLQLNYYEEAHQKISLGNMIKIYDPQMILCNNIVDIDEELNMELCAQAYDEEYEEYDEIYQFYLTNDPDLFKKLGYPTALSKILDVYVVGITHWGTSWDYVLTDIDIEEYKNWFN